MPRKQFLADLNAAQASLPPVGFEALKAGDDDGHFDLTWKHADQVITISAIVTDVTDYPTSHDYMLFCSDNAPPEFATKLDSIHKKNRKSILQLIELLTAELRKVPVKYDSDLEMYDPDGSHSESMVDDSEEEDEEEYDDDTFLTGTSQRHQTQTLSKLMSTTSKPAVVDNRFKERLRSDLQAVKDAGFRVAVLGDLGNGSNGFLAISTRIASLGISDEAMLAWQVDPNDYLLLLIYYPSSYCTLEQLQRAHATTSENPRCMRIFQSKSYKPTKDEAVLAFQKSVDQPMNITAESQLEDNMPNLKLTFLSRPFIRLLNEDLIPITRYRDVGMDWAGAEAWFRDRESTTLVSENIPDQYFKDEVLQSSFPPIVTDDHYSRHKTHSFPLVAMQFTLRHFVRCTEFCVVCHRKVSTKIEAIKPYVCERQLCLFQYMAMGFGPSIEHEILSQPYTVDLLISFCYASAQARRLPGADLPIGLGIKVPSSKSISIIPPARYNSWHTQMSNINTVSDEGPDPEEFDVGFDRARQELQFLDRQSGGCPVAKGSWIVIRMSAPKGFGQEVLHCRVAETTFFPIIQVDAPVHNSVIVETNPSHTALERGLRDTGSVTPGSKPVYTPATVRRHDLDFDDLSQPQKCDAICQILNILPSVKDMQAFLRRSMTKDLKRWVERIPASALQLLQWIIASNRACLMQVDDHAPSEAIESSTGGAKQERLYGMPDYRQFRFAMGAPDKEERFHSAVKQTAQRLKLKHPTLFAWHGSPLHNWHMIIREGLHYKNRDHGRAYGDGVYHAQDANTSMGYSGAGATCWPNSVLKVNTAIALNELVNAPHEYTSHSPYYVVQHLDWIQTRYLLVRCESGQPSGIAQPNNETKPVNPHPQDPSRTPRGLNELIVIPASAIKTGTRNAKHVAGSPSKRLKTNSGNGIAIESDSDLASIASDEEDLAALVPYTAGQSNGNTGGVTDGCAKIVLNEEDFIPGTLDFAKLPLMPMPTYAVSATTQCLMKELKRLQKTMDNTPQRELGWHLDTSAVENVYQWIVELHSFHTFEVKGQRLPMADDMKRHKVKSVVLEIRFGADFPFSPPYVRVVRPRFLSFNQGGGGHIVIGGAMCMELLTNTGWISTSSLESVLMQVRLAMASEPFARLDPNAHGDYGVAEAAEGFIRACKTHGWTVPPGFQAIAYGMHAQ